MLDFPSYEWNVNCSAEIDHIKTQRDAVIISYLKDIRRGGFGSLDNSGI